MMDELPADLPDSMQHYFLMWNERDPKTIRGHLNRAVSKDCVWVDPLHNHVGRDALEANVVQFRAEFPDADLAIGSNVDAHNNRCRYEWVITTGDKLMLRGFDVATLDDDGLIERVDGFFGTLDRFGPE